MGDLEALTLTKMAEVLARAPVVMSALADLARRRNVSRVRRRRTDKHGQPFAPYSEKYARQKGVPRDRVTMTRTRRMLDDLLKPEAVFLRAPGGLTAGGRAVQFDPRASRLRGARGRFVSGRHLDPTPIEAGYRFVDPRQEQKAQWHQKGAGSLPVREAFGLTPRQESVIDREFRRQMGAPTRPRRVRRKLEVVY